MAYPDIFDRAIRFVLRNEGGYSKDPIDPGAETKYGISKRWHPDVDIRNLTEEQAKEIYYREYWMKYPVFSQIPEPEYAVRVFDMAVLIGPSKAIAFYLANRSSMEAFRACCRGYFVSLTRKHPAEAKFLHGWLNRVDEAMA